MKKWKYLLTVVFLLVIFAALFWRWQQGGAYTRTEYLLDTRCTIQVWTARGVDGKQAVNAAFEEAEAIHALADYYSDSSDVARINQAPRGAAVAVDSRIAEILEGALEVCAKSGGSFDITVAPVKDLWDFSGKPRVPSFEEITRARESVDWSKLELDTERGTVTKQLEGMKIDLGGAAKGYAAQRAAAVLREYGVEQALLDFGGNILVMGENPNRADGIWRVGLQKPFAPTGEYGQVLELSKDLSAVTSGSYERNFEQNGRLYHHILDPHTGYPADNGLSGVSVVHSDGLLADCLSTACFVLGEEQGKALAESYGAQIYFDYTQKGE